MKKPLGKPDGRSADLAFLIGRTNQVALAGKALADENRVRILLRVARGRSSVSGIVEDVGLSQPLVSHHLKELRLSGFVVVEREGPFVYYQLAGPEIIEILTKLLRLTCDRGGEL